MAAAAFYTWDRLGRPLEPSRPVREIVERMRVAFPRAAAAKLLSWYANEEHYTANPPKDHTPFSATGWPQASPQWVVNATDIMHRPDLGLDCNLLFAYWINEARHGRMPWLKYLIWKARIYDVRNGWQAQSNSGHFDHIHISVRTDHRNTSLGSWSLTPGGDMADFTSTDVNAWTQALRVEALAKKVLPDVVSRLERIEAALKEPTPVEVDAAVFADKLADAIADKLAARLQS